MAETLGDVVFIEGVPSWGKTSVARALAKEVPEVKVIHGDELVQKWLRRRSFTPEFAREMFDRLLDRVEQTCANSDVVIDMTMPAGYLPDARTRFPNAMFVLLRVSESDRLARERKRQTKRPLILGR